MKVTADLTGRWRYAVRMSQVSALLSLPISIIASIAEYDPFSVWRTLVFAGSLWLGVSLYAVLYTCVCLLRCGTVSYEVADGALRVLRGERRLSAIPVSAIRVIRVDGYVPDRFRWLDLYLFLDWPRLVVEHDLGERVKSRSMPSIMLWGRGATDRAERELRHAIVAENARGSG